MHDINVDTDKKRNQDFNLQIDLEHQILFFQFYIRYSIDYCEAF